MSPSKPDSAALVAGCAAIFWPGSFVFGFPGAMSSHWQGLFAVGQAEVGQTLFFILLAVGSGMFVVGRWMERFGARAMVIAGGLLCGPTMIMAGLIGHIYLLYVWAFLIGAVTCFIYLPSITLIQLWFPAKRGLVSGVFNTAFAISAAIMAPLFGMVVKWIGYRGMTAVFGIIALATILVAARYLVPPKTAGREAGRADDSGRSLTLRQSLKTRNFWMLWWTWALSGAAGIAMITNAVPFGLSRGLTIQQAVYLVVAFNLTSGLSRLASGFLSDLMGRRMIMSLSFLAAGLAYLALPHLNGLVFWIIMSAFIGYAFGTMWAVSAPLAADCFGMAHFGQVFGLLYSAYGYVAGAIGPWLTGYLVDLTGNHALIFTYLAGLQLVPVVLIRLVRPARN